MALIDVVRHEMIDGEFCHKFPSTDLRIGTQLIVYPSQTAFLVKGGVICDEFLSGTYTIKTKNIPLLNKIINIPFGNETPFTAEVWFINQVNKLDIPWGTPHPLQIEDPKYKIIVPVRSHGQYGITIKNPRAFLETLIGNMSDFSSTKIDSFFKGKIISALNTLISQQIIEKGVSVLDINTLLLELSQTCNNQLNKLFAKYGIEIVDFSIMSITIPQNDDSVIRLKKAKDLAASISITGRDIYQMDRSFDVLDKMASNESVGGQILSMGAGLGVGVGLGNAMGNITSQSLNTPPPIPQEPTYHIYMNGSQYANQTISQIKSYIQQGLANAETLGWTSGMTNWVKLSELPAFSDLFIDSQLPPPLPKQ